MELKQTRKDYHKAYYQAHKEEHNEKMKEYHKKNVEQCRKATLEYYHRNKDKIKEKRPKTRYCEACDKDVSYANFALHCRNKHA